MAARAQGVGAGEKPAASEQSVLLGERLPTEHLLGDWNSLLPLLKTRGIDLTFDYESETSDVAAGGRKQGVDYVHNIGLQADMDLGAVSPLQGLSTHIAIVERAGRNASADYVGERLTQVQQLYGSGGNVAAHLGYLYAEQKLIGDKLDLEAGRLDVGQDFDASPLYCEFVTLSVCPELRSLSIESGFTIFPTSTWGGRLRINPFSPVYLQVGAFQVRPQAGGRSGFDFSTTDTTGALLPLELGMEPQFGPHKLIGHYKFGATYNTSSFSDLWEGQDGGPLAASGGTGRSHRGQASFYAAVDQMLYRTGKNGTDGLIVLGGYTHEDPHTAVIAQLAFAGVLGNGVVPGRPKDTVGAQATWFQVSRELTATQELQSASDQALSSGLSAILQPPPGVETQETVIEARYDIYLTEGLHLLPDLQYVIRPDAASRYGDATVLTLQITANF